MLAGALRAIGSNRIALTVLLVTVFANTLIWPVFQTFMPVFAAETLALDASGLGVMPLSALVLGVIAERIGVEWTTSVAAGLLVAALALLVLWTPAILRVSGREESSGEAVDPVVGEAARL